MTVLALAVVATLVLGYLLWGRLVAHQYRLDDERETPAVKAADGIDFVPTPRFYLLGQHFSAIAAAGPIAGPILACQQYGWLPSILWIGLGVVLIGAVHDFSALVASVRHRACTIAELMREHVGPGAWVAVMAFLWIALVYVLIAFVDITAATFLGQTGELDGAAFNPGGAVAGASTMYLGLAAVMGVALRFLRLPLWACTALFVPATLGVVWLGTRVSTAFVLEPALGLTPGQLWGLIILGYSFVASLLPVWLLLQPRGYLGGFVLYLALGIGLWGLLALDLPIEQPAFRAWTAPSGAPLWPFLFVTIACGACSGFHGLVCSGTTSKQIRRESDCKPVGYGAMLLEALVALIALGTVLWVADADLGGRSAGRLYGDGLGRFLAAIVGEEHRVLAATFGTMAFSTFVFDTIDVATRLGRYVVQELLRWRGRLAMAVATAATVLPPALVLVTTTTAPGQPPAYLRFWTLFGTSNQLLAGLTLLGVTVWLAREGRRVWFVAAPAAFVLAITLWALVWQIVMGTDAVLRGTAVALLVLAAFVGAQALSALRRRPRAPGR